MTIGIIDSGIGGIAALAKLVDVLGENRYIYYSDNLFAPYGNLNSEKIAERVTSLARRLASRGCEAVLILCNTAGVICGEKLRRLLSIPVLYSHPDLRIGNGCEKPLVIATKATVENLTDADCELLAAPDLASEVERAAPDFSRAESALPPLTYNCRHAKRVVLGCTHYIFLADAFARLFPSAEIVDGTDVLKSDCISLFGNHALVGGRVGSIEFLFSGRDEYDKYVKVVSKTFIHKKCALLRGRL